MSQTGVIHQDGAGLRMSGENWKHGALIVMLEMEKTIPCQDAAKLPSKSQRPHVSTNPFLIRHPVPTEGEQRRRRINASDLHARSHHGKRNWLAAAASDIEYRRTGRKQSYKPLDPALVVPGGRAAIDIPGERIRS